MQYIWTKTVIKLKIKHHSKLFGFNHSETFYLIKKSLFEKINY